MQGMKDLPEQTKNEMRNGGRSKRSWSFLVHIAYIGTSVLLETTFKNRKHKINGEVCIESSHKYYVGLLLQSEFKILNFQTFSKKISPLDNFAKLFPLEAELSERADRRRGRTALSLDFSQLF